MIIVLVGPSAVGKTTLAAELVRRGHLPLVSCTTRRPRPGEIDGRDYHFCSQPDFDWRLSRSEFAEHSWSFGHSYGLLRSEVEALPEGRVGVAVLDLDGALALHAEYPQSTVSFALWPASWDVLETRLLERGGDPVDTARRLALAKVESTRAESLCDEEIRVGETRQTAAEILAIAAVHSFRVSAPGSSPP